MSLKHHMLFLLLEALQILCDLGLAIFWIPVGWEIISYMVGHTGNSFCCSKPLQDRQWQIA